MPAISVTNKCSRCRTKRNVKEFPKKTNGERYKVCINCRDKAKADFDKKKGKRQKPVKEEESENDADNEPEEEEEEQPKEIIKHSIRFKRSKPIPIQRPQQSIKAKIPLVRARVPSRDDCKQSSLKEPKLEPEPEPENDEIEEVEDLVKELDASELFASLPEPVKPTSPKPAPKKESEVAKSKLPKMKALNSGSGESDFDSIKNMNPFVAGGLGGLSGFLLGTLNRQ